MKFQIDCVQCVIRLLIDAVKTMPHTADPARLVQRSLGCLASVSLDRTPPAVFRDVFDSLRGQSGVEDPYRAWKSRFNQYVLEHFDLLQSTINNSDHPLHTALALSIAGNIIDVAVAIPIHDDVIQRAIRTALETSLSAQTIRAFRADIERAERILYLGDNCGEIVFDMLLIGQLPREKITYVVRGQPILNDVTMADAREVGMTQLVDVIDNGAGAPGTILDLCNRPFLDEFNRADCIIAKGMGNLETLFESPRNIYFLLQVKCLVLARFLEVPVGTFLFVNRK